MQGAISFILVVFFLLSSSLTDANELQSNTSTSKCKQDPHSGMPGIPGVPGIPGTPGAPGRDGFKGEKGSIGKRGSHGPIGMPGKIGPRGPEGSKGEEGKKGEIGKMGVKGNKGIPGNSGPRGFTGSNGDKGSMGTKGSTGMPGNIGPRGSKGSKGENGIGRKGQKGNIGIPGNSGQRGFTGSKGDKGSMGTKGSMGIPGNIGPRGSKGSKGENGLGIKGQKGDAANMDPRQRANWKQCAWTGGTGTDDGKIKECSFNKLHDNTALRVSYQGNVHVYTQNGCNRWYFKFNGNECNGPLSIESVVYNNWPGGLSAIYRSHFLEGYCENLGRGTVSVELWVGKCSGYSTPSNAYTGWNSVSRIMIEEVPPSQ